MNKENNLKINPRITNSLPILSHYGFLPKKLIGIGKDAVSFVAKKENDLFVVKVLSDYAKKYLPITKDVLSKCKSNNFFDVSILEDDIIVYNYINLKSTNLSIKNFFNNLMYICDFQKELLEKNLVMWDLGITGANYMISETGMKIVDYGGNAFLYTNKNDAPIKPPRLNLVIANNEFIKQSIMLHILVIGLGQKNAASIASWIQDNVRLDLSLSKIMQFGRSANIEPLFIKISSLDLTSKLGWQYFKDVIMEYLEVNSQIIQEKADIENVIINGDEVQIFGYQNYSISSTKLTPINKGHQWANTEMKWKIVFNIMKKLKFDSYLDVGSNLGLYVFTAKILCKTKNVMGIDYNVDYIKVCKDISSKLNLGCNFHTGSLGNIDQVFECVSLLGVVHHLYCRTENFSSFAKIIEKINSISKKYVIIEVPTEQDPKAFKWINIPSRDNIERYSIENFLKEAKKRFHSVLKIDEVTSERPIFLLEK